ncbi:MAG: PIN domain-containing protein [Propionibacteriaceae bacterium]|nr:PIN domain-containing protein [Propionibacteriaceae bacterium]
MSAPRVILDTSVLIGESAPADVEAAISVVSLAELHYGTLLAAGDSDELARRTARLARVEATFEPLPVTTDVAREWGRLAAAVRTRGAQPRKRQLDLLIAATAVREQVPLLTHDIQDFAIIDDLVEVRQP